MLILAAQDDGEAACVSEALVVRGIRVVWFDTAWFPSKSDLSVRLAHDGWYGEISTPDGPVLLEEITAVYYRQSQPFSFSGSMSDPERRFATVEARFGLGGVFMSLPVRWVSHPARLADAEYRPLQMVTAARCGFAVPESLFTNRPDDARDFADKGVVYRATMHKLISEDDRVKLVYTTAVDRCAIDERVSATVHLFQGNVPKSYDVRLVATGGGRVHAVAIHTGRPGRTSGLPDRVRHADIRGHRRPGRCGSRLPRLSAGARPRVRRVRLRGDRRRCMVVPGMRAWSAMGLVARRDRGAHRGRRRRHAHGSGLVISDDDWRPRAAALADRLVGQGAVTEDVWRDVVASVPRHVFVPRFHDDDTSELLESGHPRWLDLAYSDRTLVTQRKEHPDQSGFQWSTSSSTRPTLMLQMLHSLDVRDAMNVLEIGTGTGYNAALLSERLGSEHVTTVDIDPELTDAARARLADAGYSPTVVTRDGTLGCAERAPYDRVIATVAHERMPFTWVAQSRPGGVILADVRPRGMTWAGALARLVVADDGTACGPLVECTWGFMSTRPDAEHPGAPVTIPIDATDVRARTSEVDADALRTPGLALLIWQRLAGINAFPGTDQTQITTPDGSWATVSRAVPAKVEYGGPDDIWAEVERAQSWWTERGRPGMDAFGLTVSPDGQQLWFGTPDAEFR